MGLKTHMRFVIIIIFFVNYATSKDVPDIDQKLSYQNTGTFNLIQNVRGSLQIPTDSTTIWLEDFESNVSDWRIENGWELTQESSYSPTHSFHIDDDNYDVTTSLISPIISVPPLQ